MVIDWGNRVLENFCISSELSNPTVQWIWNVSPDGAEPTELTTSLFPYSVPIRFAHRPLVLG